MNAAFGGPEDRLLAELDALIGSMPSAPPPAAAAVPTPAEPEPARSREPPAAPASSKRRRRVLVADDSKDYRKILAYLLAENGYDVVEAGDGVEGLRLARARRPDLALIDFEMPGMNGYELIQELRGSEETRRIAIVMLTGAKNRRHLQQIGLSIEAFLEKPISNADLLAALARVRDALPEARDAVDEAEEAAATPTAEQEAAVEPPVAPEPPEEAPADLETWEDASAFEQELQIEDQKKERDEDEAGLDVLANDSPLVNRINKLLVKAVEAGASDIHIEPQEHEVAIRIRCNGSLRRYGHMPKSLAPQVAARVKIMANLVITERRRPQDGQIRAMIKGRKIEFRVSTIPSVHGEKIVMRILGSAKLKAGLDDLGLRPRDVEAVRKALETPHGLILVTGPTGSGKTTTLYTMIRALNEPDVNIMTVEDPVEYELPGITQVPVKADLGLTFEKVLRSFLRQDPDIMLVGEIRDLETAEIAVKAAITGHLVLSTLHTNSAAAAVTRLTHMGTAPYLLADSVRLILAQRLIKTLCPACKAPAAVPADAAQLLTPEERAALPSVFEPKGCAACHQTGFVGRQTVIEVLELRSPEMRQLVLEQKGTGRIAAQAAQEGMQGLRAGALAALAAGQTSLAEALGVMLGE